MKFKIQNLQDSDSKIVRKTLNLFLVLLASFICLTSCDSKDNEIVVENPRQTEIPKGTLNLGKTISRDFIGQVIDERNNVLVGATVKIGNQSRQTDANGFFTIKSASVSEKMAYVTATKSGFLNGSRSLVPTDGTNKVKIMLYSSTPTQSIDSGASSTVVLSNGTKVTFDGSFKTDAGTLYNGPVSVIVKHLDPSDPKIDQKMPGMLLAQNTTGQVQVLQTFGMIDVVLLGSGGQKLQIVNPSVIEMPITTAQLSSAPATIPLWHFDTTAGYWIEEGVATKVGNFYKGTVSHFSWWNADNPSNQAALTITVVNTTGNPLNNVRVDILPNGYTYAAQGYTNTLGLVSGAVPANLAFNVMVYDTCGNLILTLLQPALAIGSITNLPNIVIPNSTSSTVVTGTLLKCDNTVVTNGYVLINYGTYTQSALVTNGTFSFNSLVCPSTPTFTYQGYDFVNLQTTGLLTGIFTTPNTILGNITACTAVTEYVTYQIDSGLVNNITVDVSANNFQGAVFNIKAGAPNTAGSVGFFLQGTSMTLGTYTTSNGYNLEGNFLVGTSFVSNSSPNNILFNLTSFGAVGQYVDLTFNGSYTDSASVAHTITGSVHAIRDL